LNAGLGARDKERRSEREAVKPLEIDVAKRLIVVAFAGCRVARRAGSRGESSKP